MTITKNHLYNILVGGLYEFRIFEVIDAAKQKYYIGSPVGRGGTKTADTIEELQQKLEMQVEPLNRFTEMVLGDPEPVIKVAYDIEKYNEIDDRYFYRAEAELSKQKSKTRKNKKRKKSPKRARAKIRPNDIQVIMWGAVNCKHH